MGPGFHGLPPDRDSCRGCLGGTSHASPEAVRGIGCHSSGGMKAGPDALRMAERQVVPWILNRLEWKHNAREALNIIAIRAINTIDASVSATIERVEDQMYPGNNRIDLPGLRWRT